ncbi:MAG: 30S ribosomal protein S8, partial [Myxococcota bacterium]
MTDPVGDMLTRIRNAGRAKHHETKCPASKVKMAVARVLSKEGFVGEVSSEKGESHDVMTIAIRYRHDGRVMLDHIQRVSKPGCRVYVGAKEVPLVRKGLGMAILSTPKG